VSQSPIAMKVALSAFLALLAASSPPMRAAVLSWIGADEILAIHAIAEHAAGGNSRYSP
jgi:hypothetical protein